MAEKKDAESARIGGILARQRAAIKQEQSDIAAALGVSLNSVVRWEGGKSKPDLWRRADVERAYHLPLGAIGGVTLHNTDVPRGTLPPGAVREPLSRYHAHPPTDTPSAALYWAVAEMQETLSHISREAARLAVAAAHPAKPRR